MAAALDRYAALIGAFDLRGAKVTIQRLSTGTLFSARTSTRAAVNVGLEPSGALRSVFVNAGTPDGICATPGIAPGDPRVRDAVIGATVVLPSRRNGDTTIRFAATDIGAIDSAIVSPQPQVFRRVITVHLTTASRRELSWTAWLDAETAALLFIRPDFTIE